MAVELIKHVIVSVHDTKSEPMLTAMETDTDPASSDNTNNKNDPTQPTQTQLDLPTIINYDSDQLTDYPPSNKSCHDFN